ncbi:MAG: TraC family protein [Candidatus Nealsonbacteria bacterium]
MTSSSTQQFLEIDQIREGLLVLKDRSLRAVMMVSSLNFALKSDEEQSSIISAFQNFLNSLDFSCQIIIQSRKLNITGYLDKIKELESKQENELLRIQTKEYHDFVQGLVSGGSIMSKSFFVVVPLNLLEAKAMVSPLQLLKSSTNPSPLTEDEFQRCKSQLWQRMEFVALGLRRCGLQAMPLTTPELIELFWSLHHPKEAEVGYFPEIPPELAK